MKKSTSIIFWSVLAVFFVGLVIFTVVSCDRLLESDASSDLVLANLLSKQGGIVSADWYYSTELHIFHTQIISALLFRLTDSWRLVRILTAISQYILLLVSSWYCCRQLKVKRAFPIVGILLLAPLSWMYVKNYLRAVFYIPAAIISFTVLGLLTQYARTEKRSGRILLLSGMGALSLVAGLGGPRHLLVLYIPMLAAAGFMWFNQHLRPAQLSQGNAFYNRLLIGASLSSILALVGYLINTKVLTRFFSFSKYDWVSFTEFNLDNFLAAFMDSIKGFGFKTGGVFSSALIFNVLAALLILLTLIELIRNVSPRSANATIPEHSLLCLFFVFGLAAYMLVCTFTNQTYYPTYQLPIFIFAFPVIALWFENNDLSFIGTKCVAAAFVLLLVGCSAANYWHYAQNDHAADTLKIRYDPIELQEIANAMVDAGYTTGYSTFWQGGNVLTELSNGEIDMYVFNNEPDSTIDDLYPWLQEKRHFTSHPDGPFFLLFSTNQLGVLDVTNQQDESNIVYLSDNFVAYGYDSYEAYQESIAESEGL